MPRFAVSLFSIVASLATVVLPAYPQARLIGTVRGVQMVNVRSGPGPEHPVLRALVEGAQVEILSIQDTWAQIRLPDGRVGYIHNAFLETRGAPAGTEQDQAGITPDRPTQGSTLPTQAQRATSTAAPMATPTRQHVRSPAAPIVPTPTATIAPPMPTESPRAAARPAEPTPRFESPTSAEPGERSEDAQAELQRMLRLTEEVHSEIVGGRHPAAGIPSPPDVPGVASTLALTGVGVVIGFLLGTIYGRRQERNRRTRVRF